MVESLIGSGNMSPWDIKALRDAFDFLENNVITKSLKEAAEIWTDEYNIAKALIDNRADYINTIQRLILDYTQPSI